MLFNNITKKLLIIAIIILLTFGTAYAGIEIYKSSTKGKEKANIIPVFTGVQENSENANRVWCGTFNIVWNDLIKYLNKDKVEFADGIESELLNELNKQSFTENDISSDSYFKVTGFGSEELKQQVVEGLKEFGSDSNIVDKINWDNKDSYILYCMLKKEFNFIEPFALFGEGMVFNQSTEKIKSFGIDRSHNFKASQNVEVLFWENEYEFAIKLKTRENEEVYLIKSDNLNSSFDDVFNRIIQKTKDYNGNREFLGTDVLKIPFIKLNDDISYNELCLRAFKEKEYEYIQDAIQTIQFELNNIGGSVKSEAVIASGIESGSIPEREMIFDSNFMLFLKEGEKDKPYFALKVDNLDVLVEKE